MSLDLLAVHTVPIWEEKDGTRRPPLPGEVRDDLPVVGWGNLLHVSINGHTEWLLAADGG